jgi:hypothetical protein
MPASVATTTGVGANDDVIIRSGPMPTGKTKLLRTIAAQERRQEREAKREARRQLRAERRAGRDQRSTKG